MSGAPKLVVSLHDVHPGSREAIAAQREALAAWGVPCRSLLVVPEFHHGPKANGSDFAAAVREWAGEGDEVVLHGYYHDRLGRKDALGSLFWTRLYTNREAEFLDLDGPETVARLAAGSALFAEAGFPVPVGFIAPAWLMGPEVIPVLRAAGFRHTTTLRDFLPLQRGGRIASQSLCWSTRAAWRRVVSVWWNERLFSRSLGNRLLRVSLHPDDLLHVTIRKQIERVVKTALDRGFEPVTYAAYAALQG
ncbi:MAG TPA: polysaccharide deacetylase family protein [Candidatus Methylacidiphilales bacterium]